MEEDLASSDDRFTVPIAKAHKRLEPAGQHTPWLWIGGGVLSFSVSVYLLHLAFPGGQQALQQEFAQQVPSSFLLCQMSAFGAVLMLNMINLAMRGQTGFRFTCNTLLLFINATAFTTDLLISLRWTPLGRGTNGRLFHPLRYILWAHTTPVMIYMLSLMCDMPLHELAIAMLNDIAMILSGLVATWCGGPLQAVNAVASFISFGVVLQYFYKMCKSATLEPGDSVQRRTLKVLFIFTIVLWTVFPLVWLAAELHLISVLTEHICWGLCDFMAKAVFSSQLWQSNLVSLGQRRELALKAWEDSNRLALLEKLRGSLAAKDRLMHAVTHELRTPIQGIMALASSIRDTSQAVRGRFAGASRSGLVLPAERPLAMIRSSSSCLLNIINTILDDAAAKDGKAEADKRTSLALGPLVEDIVELLSPLAHDGVIIINALAEELPLVLADLSRLQRVFFNLIGNALHFTRTGYVRVGAQLVRSEEGGPDLIEVTVADTGIGIEQNKLAAIFEPFGQLDENVVSPDGGSGLGLYLVKIALAALNSKITASSLIDHGTTFRFTLPIARPEDVEAAAAAPGLAPVQPPLGPSQSRLLNTGSGGAAGRPLGDGTGVGTSSHLPQMCAHPQRAPHWLAGGDTASRPVYEPIPNGALLDSQGRLQLLDSSGDLATAFDSGGNLVPVDPPPPPGSVDMTSSEARFLMRSLSLQKELTDMSIALDKGCHRIKHGGQLQILSVDDDVVNQLVAEQMLKSMKWKVVKAMNGPQALAYIQDPAVCLPDLVMLDVMMPGMSGYEVVSKLREQYPASLLPIIMVSARTEEQGIVEALQRGADDYVTKPYRRLDLSERIKAQVRARDSSWKLSAGLLKLMRENEQAAADAAGEDAAAAAIPGSPLGAGGSASQWAIPPGHGRTAGLDGSSTPDMASCALGREGYAPAVQLAVAGTGGQPTGGQPHGGAGLLRINDIATTTASAVGGPSPAAGGASCSSGPLPPPQLVTQQTDLSTLSGTDNASAAAPSELTFAGDCTTAHGGGLQASTYFGVMASAKHSSGGCALALGGVDSGAMSGLTDSGSQSSARYSPGARSLPDSERSPELELTRPPPKGSSLRPSSVPAASRLATGTSGGSGSLSEQLSELVTEAIQMRQSLSSLQAAGQLAGSRGSPHGSLAESTNGSAPGTQPLRGSSLPASLRVPTSAQRSLSPAADAAASRHLDASAAASGGATHEPSLGVRLIAPFKSLMRKVKSSGRIKRSMNSSDSMLDSSTGALTSPVARSDASSKIGLPTSLSKAQRSTNGSGDLAQASSPRSSLLSLSLSPRAARSRRPRTIVLPAGPPASEAGGTPGQWVNPLFRDATM